MKKDDIKWKELISGGLAGAIGTTILHPLDLLKVRFQAYNSSTSVYHSQGYRALRNAVRYTLKEEGPLAFYKGLYPSLLGSGVSWGLYFFFYEGAKERYQKNHVNEGEALPPKYHLASAWEAGTICVLLTNPIWLIKTRLQLQATRGGGGGGGEVVKYRRGLVNTFSTIIKEEGLLGLYKGSIPALILVSNGAIQVKIMRNIVALLKAIISVSIRFPISHTHTLVVHGVRGDQGVLCSYERCIQVIQFFPSHGCWRE